MPHASLNVKVAPRLALLTGFPGFGYETVIAELTKLNVRAEKWDSRGFRTHPLRNNEWNYDLNTLNGTIYENEFRDSPIDVVSMGGGGAIALTTLPWSFIFILKGLSGREYLRRANLFRKSVGMKPISPSIVEEVIAFNKGYMSAMTFTGSHVVALDANDSPAKLAKKIKQYLDEYRLSRQPIPTDNLYHEFVVPLPFKETKLRNLYVLRGGNAAGKTYLCNQLRELGYAAVSGDRLALIATNILYGRPPYSPESKDNKVNWSRVDGVVIPETIMDGFDVVSGTKAETRTSKKVVTIGLVPKYFDWAAAKLNRDAWLQYNHRPDGGHFASYRSTISKGIEADFIIQQTYGPDTLKRVLSLINLCESQHSALNYDEAFYLTQWLKCELWEYLHVQEAPNEISLDELMDVVGFSRLNVPYMPHIIAKFFRNNHRNGSTHGVVSHLKLLVRNNKLSTYALTWIDKQASRGRDTSWCTYQAINSAVTTLVNFLQRDDEEIDADIQTWLHVISKSKKR